MTEPTYHEHSETEGKSRNDGAAQLKAELIAIRDSQEAAPSEAPVGRYEHLTTPLARDNEATLQQQLGLQSKDEIDVAMQHVELNRDKARILMRMPDIRVLEFAESGQYISATESQRGTSPGREAEEVNFGLRTADEQPIVSGYLGTEEDSQVEQHDASSYGGGQLTLKTDVFKRTNFSNRDTMMQGRNVVQLNKEDAMLQEEARKISVRAGRPEQPGSYTEAIIHGGITTEDVEAVSIPLTLGVEQKLDTETTIEAAEKLLLQLREKLPDARKTLQIDASMSIPSPSEFIRLAQANPDVALEFVIGTHESPPSLVRLQQEGSPYPDISQGHIATSQRASQDIIARKAIVDAGLAQIAQDSGLAGLPPNIKTALSYSDRRFVGHHTDNQ